MREAVRFENWNRYSDPDTGRYVSPEPMMQDAQYVGRMAKRQINSERKWGDRR